MSKPEIVMRAALTIGGPSVYHEIRGNVVNSALLVEEVARLAKENHILRSLSVHQPTQRIRENGRVFIGHGHSHVWRDLKEFIHDRLHLPWDEFNREYLSIGVTIIDRLCQMLDDAAIAFLVLTAEDEQKDGMLNARMNVVHEAGLFQGRLGFDKAIILLEEGCEEFSNIRGLGHIRFSKNNIKSVFEDIRYVLEKQGLINR